MNNNLERLLKILEEKASISEVISNYIDIEKKGNNYSSVCPFHKDTNPSLFISDTKGIFKCFSCGVGGNVYRFLSKKLNINFIESVKIVADQYKIDWSKYIYNRKIIVSKEVSELWKINEDIKNYYKYQLANSNLKTLTNFTKVRNLDDDLLEFFNIGYIDFNGNKLYDFLLNKNHTPNLIESTRMFTRDKLKTDKWNMLFYNRLIFPIHDENNNVIGFSGRTISDSKPKYLNSVENMVFKKSSILFNLNNAKNYIYSDSEIILVEGFFDVISYYKLNIKNVVATMGVFMTERIAQYLCKLVKNIYLSFDNDEAGINASISIGEKLFSDKLNLRVIIIPSEYKDFDEYLSKIKLSSFDYEFNSVDYIDFIIGTFKIRWNEKPNFDELNRLLENVFSKIQDVNIREYKLRNFADNFKQYFTFESLNDVVKKFVRKPIINDLSGSYNNNNVNEDDYIDNSYNIISTKTPPNIQLKLTSTNLLIDKIEKKILEKEKDIIDILDSNIFLCDIIIIKYTKWFSNKFNDLFIKKMNEFQRLKSENSVYKPITNSKKIIIHLEEVINDCNLLLIKYNKEIKKKEIITKD